MSLSGVESVTEELDMKLVPHVDPSVKLQEKNFSPLNFQNFLYIFFLFVKRRFKLGDLFSH